MRKLFIKFVIITIILNGVIAIFFKPILWSLIILGPIILLGLKDYFQKSHTILRNFPFLGRFRYILEEIRPEIQQYFIESNDSGRPFTREDRSVVYQRAKKVLDTLPFGTQKNVYAVGYEWVNHSLSPKEHIDPSNLRITVGGPDL